MPMRIPRLYTPKYTRSDYYKGLADALLRYAKANYEVGYDAGYKKGKEEVKEWNPRELKPGDNYWVATYETERKHEWYGKTDDRYFRALGNCHPTKEAAEEWRHKLLADDK